jgi:DNA-binding CsgD family transcriptional regulator
MFLISREVDSVCRRIGRSSHGLIPFALFTGFSLGSIVILLLISTDWYLEVFKASNDIGIVYATTTGAITIAMSYICMNVLINRSLLRNIELLSKGRFHWVGPLVERIHEKGEGVAPQAALSEVDLITRCRDITLENGLTPREFEVLVVLARGNSLARVKDELVISEGTAITHRRNIYQKLSVHSKQELLDYVWENKGGEGQQPQ